MYYFQPVGDSASRTFQRMGKLLMTCCLQEIVNLVAQCFALVVGLTYIGRFEKNFFHCSILTY